MWWLLAREVLRLRGKIDRHAPWEVMVDLFFYRDPEETEKEEQTGPAAQDYDAPQYGTDTNYQDDGPSMMPAAETFAGNQENWGASATDNWAATGGEATEWSATNPGTTGVTGAW